VANLQTAIVCNPPSHPITAGPFGSVSSFIENFPGCLSDLGPFAKALATNSLGVTLAVIEANTICRGSGRVVIYSDINQFGTGTNGCYASNVALFLNMIDYCRRPPCAPVVSIRQVAAGQVEVYWPSESNGYYQVEFRTSTLASAWAALGGPCLATNSMTSICDALQPDRPQRYYRVFRTY